MSKPHPKTVAFRKAVYEELLGDIEQKKEYDDNHNLIIQLPAPTEEVPNEVVEQKPTTWLAITKGLLKIGKWLAWIIW